MPMMADVFGTMMSCGLYRTYIHVPSLGRRIKECVVNESRDDWYRLFVAPFSSVNPKSLVFPWSTWFVSPPLDYYIYYTTWVLFHAHSSLIAIISNNTNCESRIDNCTATIGSTDWIGQIFLIDIDGVNLRILMTFCDPSASARNDDNTVSTKTAESLHWATAPAFAHQLSRRTGIYVITLSPLCDALNQCAFEIRVMHLKPLYKFSTLLREYIPHTRSYMRWLEYCRGVVGLDGSRIHVWYNMTECSFHLCFIQQQ